MADIADLKSVDFGRVGSSPTIATICKYSLEVKLQISNLASGVRFSLLAPLVVRHTVNLRPLFRIKRSGS